MCFVIIKNRVCVRVCVLLLNHLVICERIIFNKLIQINLSADNIPRLYINITMCQR